MTDEIRIAVVVTGPEWWGDPTLKPDGKPVMIERVEERREHFARAAAETAGAHLAIDELPEDCMVIYVAGRGAVTRFSEAASRRRLPLAIVPADAIVDVVVGLGLRGWRLKVLCANGDEKLDRLSLALRAEAVFVKAVQRHVEPEEPEVQGS